MKQYLKGRISDNLVKLKKILTSDKNNHWERYTIT